MHEDVEERLCLLPEGMKLAFSKFPKEVQLAFLKFPVEAQLAFLTLPAEAQLEFVKLPEEMQLAFLKLPNEVRLALVKLPVEVQKVFADTKCGTPDRITPAGCMALAKLGKDAWNAWRAAFPVKDRFNGYPNRADFSGETFLDGHDFSGFNFGALACFDGAKFGHFVFFEDASFGQGTTFRDAVFETNISFRRCSWLGVITFSKTEWRGVVSFDGCSELSVDFSDSHLMGKVSFVDCQLTEADFSSTKFDKSVSLINCSVEKEINFHGAAFAECVDFSNTKFEGKTDFSNVTFGKAPLFHGCEIHQNTSFEGASFPEPTGDEEAERAYRTLKLAFNKHQAIREEQKFFRWEMAEEALRHKGAKRALFWLYKVSSDYGFSLKQPCLVLLFIFIFMAAIYGLVSLSDNACQEVCTFSPQWLSFSLLQTLPILGMDKQAWDLYSAFWPAGSGWESLLIFLVAIHKTLSLVAFFLIGLALRNLFKLK